MVIKAKELRERVDQVLEKYQHDKGMLVSILQDVQSGYNYLPENALKMVSHGLKVPMSQVYSVVTFFKTFSLIPRGRHLVSVCLGTACHVRGAVRVLEKFERELGVSSGETTKDLKCTLETVNCVGACAGGPVVKVDEEYHGEMTADKVGPVLKDYA